VQSVDDLVIGFDRVPGVVEATSHHWMMVDDIYLDG
jgi:hypothetical protein